MEFFEDEDEEPKIKKYLEWIIIPATAILAIVAFALSVNGIVLVTKWNLQFVAPDEPKNTCDQLRQSRRKYETTFLMPKQYDYVDCVCLGVISLMLLAAFFTARVVNRKKHKTKCYTSVCGFNCTMLILLTVTVAILTYINKDQQFRRLRDGIGDKNTQNIQLTPQHKALRIFISGCMGSKENETTGEFNEEDYAWEDADNETIKIKFSDCYSHCIMGNSHNLMIVSIALASSCVLFGSPVIYFIIQFWRPKRRLNDDRYAHLNAMARGDPDRRPAYMLNEDFIRTPQDYTFEHTSFYYNNSAY